MTREILKIVLLLMVSAKVYSLPITFVEIESEGIWTVPFGDYYFDESNSKISASNSYPNNPTYFQNSPSIGVSYTDDFGSSEWFIFRFSSHELGGPMTIGSYESAEYFPVESSDSPGISISSRGRGGSHFGSFEIFDIAYQDNDVLRFAVNFTANDRVKGRISYNSEAFVEVPEPSVLLLLLTGALVIFATRVNGLCCNET